MPDITYKMMQMLSLHCRSTNYQACGWNRPRSTCFWLTHPLSEATQLSPGMTYRRMTKLTSGRTADSKNQEFLNECWFKSLRFMLSRNNRSARSMKQVSMEGYIKAFCNLMRRFQCLQHDHMESKQTHSWRPHLQRRIPHDERELWLTFACDQRELWVFAARLVMQCVATIMVAECLRCTLCVCFPWVISIPFWGTAICT